MDNEQKLRMPPEFWKNTGYKLKITKYILQLYLRILEEQRPNCTAYVRIHLLNHPEMNNQGWSVRQIYGAVENLRRRISCTYYATTTHKIGDISQEIGMLPYDEYIELVKKAIKLPKEYCGDFHYAD
jgi:hypothetical protein